MYIDVDVVVSLPVNIFPLIDDTDFKTREVAIVYNEAGMDLVWNFVTVAGVMSQTAVTPTTGGGDYDWTNVGDGMYKIGIPDSGGGSINNDTVGMGWFTGICTGVLAWASPVFYFREAGLNNLLIDSKTANLDDQIILLKGMLGANCVLDDFYYDSNSKATIGNLYVYSTAGQVATHESPGGGPGLLLKIEGVATIGADGNTAQLNRTVA